MEPSQRLGYGMPGLQWQTLCEQVLRQEHGPSYQRVPDTGGDGGIEGFTHAGLAYQCYSPNEPLSTEQRHEKLRNKMTDDVGKFISNTSKFKDLFGTTVKIRYWTLLVPYFDDKRIVGHATRSQTKRLRDANLSYTESNCCVIIQTLDDYAASVQAVMTNRLVALNLPQPGTASYSALGDDIAIARAKLEKIPVFKANPEKLKKYLDNVISSNLIGRELVEYIRDHFPELGQSLDSEINEIERRLETEYPLRDDPPNQLLLNVQRETEEGVKQAIPNLKRQDSSDIAYGQIAEWLMRCPLDFA